MRKGKHQQKDEFESSIEGHQNEQRESIQDYFTRVSQFKEQLSYIGDTLDEDEEERH